MFSIIPFRNIDRFSQNFLLTVCDWSTHNKLATIFNFLPSIKYEVTTPFTNYKLRVLSNFINIIFNMFLLAKMIGRNTLTSAALVSKEESIASISILTLNITTHAR